MARPARPERSRSALPLRQLSRFCYLINSDIVFGTHRHWLSRIRRVGPCLAIGTGMIDRMRTWVRCCGLSNDGLVHHAAAAGRIAATIASLDMYVAPLDAPWSSGPVSDDLVHS